jgi:hypothetical protein
VKGEIDEFTNNLLLTTKRRWQKMKKPCNLTLICAALLVVAIVSLARADYILVKDVLSTSGGHLESASYLLDFSTGQTAVGMSQGTSHIETGGFWSWSPWGEVVAVEEQFDEMLPVSYRLSQNYPNPFNPQTHISYRLPQGGHVTLVVYNVRGQRVGELVDWQQSAGEHVVTWDGLDDAGSAVASGIYFYQLTAGEFSETRKMLLLK